MILDNHQFQIFFQLFLAVFLGGLIGLEREYRRKEAGLRTYALVTLGSCLFTIISFSLFNLFPDNIKFDPAAIVQAVAIGVGFLGAGVIFRQEAGVVGLTTAAGLWVAAAIGITVGASLYSIAVFTTLLTILVFAGFGWLEGKVIKAKITEEKK
jgi:putative Mg2+ transporter-C (MgtC) family protein